MTGRRSAVGIGDGELAVDEAPDFELAAAALDLARRFRAGATAWCVAPTWPGHAIRLAAYLRVPDPPQPALNAVATIGSEPIASLRAQVRLGDVIVGLGRGSDPTIVELMQRAPGWGCTRVWIGAGRPPAGALAEHVLWRDGEPTDVAHDGRLMTTYHLLGELTRRCLEQSDLLGPAPEPAAEAAWLAEMARYAGRTRGYERALLADVAAVHASTLDRAVGSLHARLLGGGSILAMGDESGVGAVAALGRATPASAPPKGRVGTRLVPAHQLVRRSGPKDIAMVFSSGHEVAGLAPAVAEARDRALLTIGFLGDRSGLRDTPFDHCFVVRSETAERVREAHAALVWDLWLRLQGPRPADPIR